MAKLMMLQGAPPDEHAQEVAKRLREMTRLSDSPAGRHELPDRTGPAAPRDRPTGPGGIGSEVSAGTIGDGEPVPSAPAGQDGSAAGAVRPSVRTVGTDRSAARSATSRASSASPPTGPPLDPVRRRSSVT